MRIIQILAIKRLAVVFLLLAAILSFPFSVKAENEIGDIFLPQGTVHNDIFFAAGNNLNINGQMKDDVYLAGANVNVSGVMEEDLIVVGANVVIEAEVKGNLRVAGASVTIKGNVGKNVTVAAADLTIDKNVQIGKNLIFGGANAKINGKVNKNLYGGGANLILNGEIGGSAYLQVDPEGSLVLYPEANINGNLEYTAMNKANLQPGAKIGQQQKFSQLEKETPKAPPFKALFGAFFWLRWLVGLLGTLVVGMVLVSLFKDFTETAESIFDKQVLWYFLLGFVVLIVTPIALLILGITLIGLPLAMILGALYLIALYLAKIFVAIYLGEKIITVINKAKEVKFIWSMVVGTVVLYLLFLIPFVGLLAKLAATLWGLGVLAVVIKKQLKLGNNN